MNGVSTASAKAVRLSRHSAQRLSRLQPLAPPVYDNIATYNGSLDSLHAYTLAPVYIYYNTHFLRVPNYYAIMCECIYNVMWKHSHSGECVIAGGGEQINTYMEEWALSLVM